MRLQDRHGRQFALGPTHEELVTSIVRNELKSQTITDDIIPNSI